MTTETIYSVDDLETIYSLDDLFGTDSDTDSNTDSEHDQVSAEEDEFIYEMLANYDDDEDFLSEIYSELYGE